MSNISATINETIQLEKIDTSLDFVKNEDGSFHILKDNQSYHATIQSISLENKTFELLINGTPYTVQLHDEFDKLVKKLGLSIKSAQKVNEIKAPMPGLVLDILVEAGQSIQKGDGLLILEAMKMENVIKAPSDGVINSISINKGNTVDKNELMIVLD